ncbi:MAG: extracellular solute-binding protein [Ruminococcaceae bacterium]|nr:extracellular solute-binding protein [Oscillospiraceae bacterium]
MKKHTWISILLLTALLCASCGEGAADPADTGTAAVGTGTETEAVTEDERIVLDMTDRDYGGDIFHIVNYDNVTDNQWVGIPDDIFCEEETGDLLGDAVYQRNRTVEETLNIKITSEKIASVDLVNTIRKSVMAGNTDYDAVFPSMIHLPDFINGGLVIDLNTLDGLDLSYPWWDQNAIELLTVSDRLFSVVSDITFIDKLACMTTFFNKEMAKQNDVGDLYAMVEEGKWTFDAMMTLSQGVSRDVNGDGVYDKEDSYGHSSQNDIIYVMLHSAGVRICENTADGVVFSLGEEKAIDILEKTFEMMADKQLFFNRQAFNLTVAEGINMMIDNRTLFLTRPMQTVMVLRDMKADFGIIPYPKYSEDQESYSIAVNPYAATTMVVPNVIEDPAKTADVLQLLACESYYEVIDPFYNLVLDTKLVRDEQASKMLDIIFDSRMYDIGMICNFGGIFNPTLISSAGKPVASLIESNEAKIVKDIEKFLESISDYEE